MLALIVFIIAVVAVLSLLTAVLFETSIVVQPGTLALLLKHGQATDRAVGPGRHFVQPWRKAVVQVYPSRELALVTGGGAPLADQRVETVEAPLQVFLGDRTAATLSFTVRCQLDVDQVKMVHDRFGPEGLWSALRDSIRRCVLTEISAADVTVDDAFGDRRAALERRLEKALRAALDEVGFVLRMFNLREVDLGETGEVIQSTLRAGRELEREHALAEVRRARIENDASMRDLLSGVDGEIMLRYRQIEVWRDLVQRWDGGDQPIPSALTMPLLTTALLVDHETEQLDDAPADEPQ
jgi:regulator of protease activity HflC (stomatin/prohibitin superfamily)